MLRRLFKRRVCVKPVAINRDQWLVTEENGVSSFFDDWRRYGLRVAFFNLRAILTDD